MKTGENERGMLTSPRRDEVLVGADQAEGVGLVEVVQWDVLTIFREDEGVGVDDSVPSRLGGEEGLSRLSSRSRNG